jgi:hypothetical protein
VTPPVVCTTLTSVDAKALRRAALITLRRAICDGGYCFGWLKLAD